jgi:hypothetical protein
MALGMSAIRTAARNPLGVARSMLLHGSYVDRILRGAKPGDLPVQAPTEFDFTTAKALATSPHGRRISPPKLKATFGSAGVHRGGAPDRITRLPNLWVVVQDHVQQGGVNFQFSIVFDKAQFAKFVHEKAHRRLRSSRASFRIRPWRGTTLLACGGIGSETIWQSVQSYTIRRTSMQPMHRPGSRLMRMQGASFSILPNGMNDWRGWPSSGKHGSTNRFRSAISDAVPARKVSVGLAPYAMMRRLIVTSGVVVLGSRRCRPSKAPETVVYDPGRNTRRR